MTASSFSSGGGPDDWASVYRYSFGSDGVVTYDPVKKRYYRARTVDHPYTLNVGRWTREPAVLHNPFGAPGSTETYWVYNTTYPDRSQSWGANDDLKLLNRLSEKIKGHDFNAGIFAAEGHQAVATIRNSAVSLFDLYKGVKHGNIPEALRALGRITGHKRPPRGFQAKMTINDIAGAWLAIKYAWEPLIKDVYSAAKAIERMSDGERLLKFSATNSIYGRYTDDSSSAIYDVTWKKRSKIIYKLSIAPTEQRTWGLYDPVSIAWELVPFSFVIDWFIPVGQFLDSRSFFGSISGSWVRTDMEFWSGVGVGIKAPGYQIL